MPPRGALHLQLTQRLDQLHAPSVDACGVLKLHNPGLKLDSAGWSQQAQAMPCDGGIPPRGTPSGAPAANPRRPGPRARSHGLGGVGARRGPRARARLINRVIVCVDRSPDRVALIDPRAN